MLKSFIKLFSGGLLLGCCLLPWNATADKTSIIPGNGLSAFSSNQAERLLVQSLLEINEGRLREALSIIDQLVKAVPNFRLAHMVRGDLLMAFAQQRTRIGQDNTAALTDFEDEARVRIERHLDSQHEGKLPDVLWRMAPDQRYAIVIETSKSRLYVYENRNNQPHYLVDYYITMGKNGSEKFVEGDKRTPIGVYTASKKLDRKLPDFYGEASYPLNYPNALDQKQGRKGHGIWLHGTPQNVYSRPPKASDGCVVLANADLRSLGPILQQGATPVIISNTLQWISVEEARKKQKSLDASLEQWRHDWETQNTEQYLAHYSKDFFSDSGNLENWSRNKRRIQAAKSKVQINLSNLSMFRYPNATKPMVQVTFDQDYRSNVLANRMKKQQYWIWENQRWQIIYEGSA
ncbi:Murein L,D-transpeptidase YafK [Methylobacillus rhizosphaerae]|uniref:Murein L,D-transpeptidase YafK n=1 Tax=Methylobacillus rhizosphaerae TaxID=551994 RepID=A0A238ZXP0_9PROT|nr:L,D-transpeptidase family protein [Methylobacillus rhizosphaerae]SNR88206.1 Murein L,D-transpeptidase YafK [Methylobacillus rhizosphaerae]